jgi:NADPH-dependent ferric siderophore reductase
MVYQKKRKKVLFLLDFAGAPALRRLLEAVLHTDRGYITQVRSPL